MNRLTNTWRQQKPLAGRENVKPTTGVINRTTTTATKRLGQHAIPRTYSAALSVATSTATTPSKNMVEAKKRKVLSPKQDGRGGDQNNGGVLRRSPRFKGTGGGDDGHQVNVRRPGMRRRSPRLIQESSSNNQPAASTNVTTPEQAPQTNSSFNSSFGTDIDINEDFLLALEQVEADYHDQNVEGQTSHAKDQTGQDVEKQPSEVSKKKEFVKFVKHVPEVPTKNVAARGTTQNTRERIVENALCNKSRAQTSTEVSTNEPQRNSVGSSIKSRNVSTLSNQERAASNNQMRTTKVNKLSAQTTNQTDTAENAGHNSTSLMPNSNFCVSTSKLCNSNDNSLNCVAASKMQTSSRLSANPIPNSSNNSSLCNSGHRVKCNNNTISGSRTSAQSCQQTSHDDAISGACTSRVATKSLVQDSGTNPTPVTRTRTTAQSVQQTNLKDTTNRKKPQTSGPTNKQLQHVVDRGANLGRSPPPITRTKTAVQLMQSSNCKAAISHEQVIAGPTNRQLVDRGANPGRSPAAVTRNRTLMVEVSPPERSAGSSPQGGSVLCEDSQSPGEEGTSKKGAGVVSARAVSKALPPRQVQQVQAVNTRDDMVQEDVDHQVDLGDDDDDDMSSSQGFETSHLSPPPNKSQSSPNRSLMSPSHNSPDPLALASWGLPDSILQQYHQNKVTHMFQWQAECLRTGNVLEGGNLVYSAPTSAGKTLVAELLVMKRVLETKKKALFILPFVSVSREKMFYLQNLLQDAGIRVDGYMGKQGASGGFGAVDVAICTIERANSLINRLLEESKLHQLGIIVVDELHMVGDSNRGYLLELLLTKIRYVTSLLKESTKQRSNNDGNESQSQSVLANPIQLVGMSATLPNLNVLASWLDADLYTTDFRPVPLTEAIKIGPIIYDNQMKKVRDFVPMVEAKGDEEHILALCLETMAEGCSVLVFCPTKNWCEKLCETMAREIARMNGVLPTQKTGFVLASKMAAASSLNRQGLTETIEQLKRTPSGLDSVLKKTLPYGVAYHHAGLTFDERDIVEGAFRLNNIRILVATSTLSSGVNLPARRVIIRSIMFNRKVLDPLTYKQMAGRAGRKGVDTLGESILVCKLNEKAKATNLVKTDLPPVQSCLIGRGEDDLSSSMKRAILEVIASGVASSPDDVKRYAASTLLASSMTSDISEDDKSNDVRTDTSEAISGCVKFLQEREFIRLQTVKNRDTTHDVYKPTQLGSATLASALTPDEALVVFTELQRARKSFVLENELHIIYQVTPIYSYGFYPDWYQFMCQWETLSTDKRRVAELVGVEERFLVRATRGNIPKHTAKQQHTLAIHNRFYVALILNDLVNEMPLNAVARKYACARGQLQSLQQNAATFAGMVTVFCGKLGWYNLELLLAQFQNRLNFGVQRELCDLVRISLLNAYRARLLYNNGFHSVSDVANARPAQIENLLRIAVPFQSSRRAIDEKQYEAEERHQSRCIWATGRKGLTEAEAAGIIVSEAREILQKDLGISGVQWGSRNPGAEGNVQPSGVPGGSGGDGNGRTVGHQTTMKNARRQSASTPRGREQHGIVNNGRGKSSAPRTITMRANTNKSVVSVSNKEASNTNSAPRTSALDMCTDTTQSNVPVSNRQASGHQGRVAANGDSNSVSAYSCINKEQERLVEGQQVHHIAKPVQAVRDGRNRENSASERNKEIVDNTNVKNYQQSSNKRTVAEDPRTNSVPLQRSSSGSEGRIQSRQNAGESRQDHNAEQYHNAEDSVPERESGATRNCQKKQIEIQADVHATRSQSTVGSTENSGASVNIARNVAKDGAGKTIHTGAKTLQSGNRVTTVPNTSGETDLRQRTSAPNESSDTDLRTGGTSAVSHIAASNTGCSEGSKSKATGAKHIHNEHIAVIPSKNVHTPTLLPKESAQQTVKDASPELFSEGLDLPEAGPSVACSTPNEVASDTNRFSRFSNNGCNVDINGVNINRGAIGAGNRNIKQADHGFVSTTSENWISREQNISGVPDVAADVIAPSPGGQSDFSPSFPSMDSQMLRLVDEVCAQNEAIARTASPNLLQRTSKESAFNGTKFKVLKLESGTLKSYEIDLDSCPVEQHEDVHTGDELNVQGAVADDNEHNLDDAVAMDTSDSFDFPADDDAHEALNQAVSDRPESSASGPLFDDDQKNRSPFSPPVSLNRAVSARPESSASATLFDDEQQNRSPFSPPVYSQLEADMQLAAEWSDTFSCEESSLQHQPQPQPQPGPQPQPQPQQVGTRNTTCNPLVALSKGTVGQRDNEHRVVRERLNAFKSKRAQSMQQSNNQCTENGKKTSKNFAPTQTTTRQARNKTSSSDNNVTTSTTHDQFSPGTMAMLDMFAGEDDSSVNSRTGRCSKTVPHNGAMTVTSLKQNDTGSLKGRNENVEESGRTLQGRSSRKRKSDEYLPQGGAQYSEGVSPPKKNKETEASVRRVSPRRLSRESASQGGEERRTSDGDFLPPTPPEKPNTPKLLKGTIRKSAKTPQTKVLSGASASRSRRSSQRIRTQQQKSQNNAIKIRQSATKKHVNKNVPKTRAARKTLHLSPPEDSQALFSERDPDESQLCDMNKALDGSDLDLRLDTSSDSASLTPKTNKPNPTMQQLSPRMPQSSPMIPCTDGAFTIIDVCTTRELFEMFLEEWKGKVEYSFSVACETYQPPVDGGGIGGKFKKGTSRTSSKADGILIEDEHLLVTGLAVCWGDKDAYFVSFQDKPSQDPDESLAQPAPDPELPINERLQSVKVILDMEHCLDGNHGNEGRNRVVIKSAFDLKQQYKALSRSCGIVLGGSVRDPKVAHWLFDPGAKEKNLQGLVTQYLPTETHLLEDIGGGIGVGGLGLTAQNPGSGRLRASTESVLVHMLMTPLNGQLKEEGLLQSFEEVEMPSQVTISRMELNGFGFNGEECESQKTIMQAKLSALEEQAYQMAGHGFVLTSPDEIAQVLYAELKLPPNGDPKQANATFRKTLGARGRMKLPKHFSTSKDALEKLKPFHELPGIILEWRRITGAITKTVFPLQKEKVYHDGLGMDRIFGVCQMHTATGRVAMSDPNLQAIPKDFEIQLPSVIGESPPQGAAPSVSCLNAPGPSTRGKGRRGAAGRNAGVQQRAQMGQGSQEPSFAVSVRHAFCPFPGGVLLAADYSQLELRILAHLSKDSKLIAILNSGGDVFKQIAAKWKNASVEEITAEQRQQAKQVCYGMIYGIGAKALGETLGVGEDDGAAFMETFKMQYKGMKTYMTTTIKKCHEDGYVTTMLGRRRYLTAIHNTNAGARNHAERQAVNTTIQGSAADLVKTAMNSIDRRLAEEFPNTRRTHRHRTDLDIELSQRKRGRRIQQSSRPPSGAFLVLQLHDELIYEVHQEDAIQVAQLVKIEMETAMKLSVKLPVKVNAGPTWGSMEALEL